jgi:hypothetical protein
MATYISKIKAYAGSDVDFLNDVIVTDEGDGPRIEQWNLDTPVKPTDEQLDALDTEASAYDTEVDLVDLRSVRNAKLAETDWVVTMHKELGTNIPAAWKTYRQALRDITDTYTSLDDVVWPEKPE